MRKFQISFIVFIVVSIIALTIGPKDCEVSRVWQEPSVIFSVPGHYHEDLICMPTWWPK